MGSKAADREALYPDWSGRGRESRTSTAARSTRSAGIRTSCDALSEGNVLFKLNLMY